MHVIVGQGQLDSILHATPEDRRGFIEEAAGVLKHRKRKEKALRKLDATEGNLTRLGDLLSEIRRQLKPLGRQAEVARRAAVVQADVRDARARLLADDLVTARDALEQELADESVLLERRERGRGRDRRGAGGRGAPWRQRCARTCRRWRAAQETWFGLSGLRERLRGTASLAAERVRNAPAGRAEPTAPGRDPEELEAEAERVRARGGRRSPPRSSSDRAALEEAVAARQAAEDAAARGGAPDRRAPARAPPTGARAWPGCTARSTGCAAGPPPPRTRSAGSTAGPRGGPRPRRAGPARLHRPGDPGRRPRRRRGGPRRRARGGARRSSPTSRSGSPSCARRRRRPTASAARWRPARRRSSSA